MKVDFIFDGERILSFDLSAKDSEHIAVHRLRAQEWSGPLVMNALNGVNWDNLLQNFPHYSLRCSECDYCGDDYDRYGTVKMAGHLIQSQEKLRSRHSIIRTEHSTAANCAK